MEKRLEDCFTSEENDACYQAWIIERDHVAGAVYADLAEERGCGEHDLLAIMRRGVAEAAS